MENKKEIIVFTIVIVVLLVITIGGITFAYFASNIDNNANLDLDVSTANDSYLFLTDSYGYNNIEINVSFNEMSEANINNEPLKSSNSSFFTGLAGAQEGTTTTCTYDIVWVWDSEDRYTESDVQLPYTPEGTDTTYNYEFSIKIDDDEETDLSKL